MYVIVHAGFHCVVSQMTVVSIVNEDEGAFQNKSRIRLKTDGRTYGQTDIWTDIGIDVRKD